MLAVTCNVGLETTDVVMLNVAVVCSAGTVTEGGTWATSDDLPGTGMWIELFSSAARPTTVGVGTACSRVTVPRLGLPPTTVAGKSVMLRRIPATTLGFTVREAETERPS